MYVQRKSVIEMAKRVNRYIFNNMGVYDFDQNYSFDWYLDVCESAGLSVAFYFIPTSRGPNNGGYEINEKRVINLIRKCCWIGVVKNRSSREFSNL